MKNKIKWTMTYWLTLFLLICATTSTAFARGNWWDKLGEPQYGGTFTFAVSAIMASNFDVYNFIGSDNNFYYEAMFEPDWTLDRNIYGMKTNFIPDKYWKGQLAETWEMPDGKTIVVHIRKNIRWQNKPPVNGREFTAYDVQAHYDRILGTGGGYTWRAPMYMGMGANIERVTARDKYTVEFKFKKASALSFQTIADRISMNVIEAPEWVALGGPPVKPEEPKGGPGPAPGGPPPPPDFGQGPLQDWTKVVGTGAWMLDKFVKGVSYGYAKNPDYWGTDPRHPKNKLPYADKLTMIVIPDPSTRVAALRTGKIDLLGNGPGGVIIDWKQAQLLKKTNPELVQSKTPAGASGIGIRVDKAPFTDIRVRKALNMAIDRKTIAKSILGGTSIGNPTGIITQEYKGYAFDYKDWPKSLKNEYTYNPKEAKKLLAQAGFPKGFKTNVVAATNETLAMEIIQSFKSYFKDIGVDMEIRGMDGTTAQSFVRSGKHDQLSGQGGAATFPPSRLMDVYYSTGGSDAVFYGLNNAPDKTYDKLHDDFINATNPDKAAKIFQQMDRRIIEQHYIVTPCEAYTYMIWQPYLKGYSGELLFWGQGIMWSRLWVDSALKKKMGR